MDTIFTTLLSPLADFFKDSGANIDKKAASTKLFFEDFFQKIVFAFQNNISSLRSLSLELQTNPTAKALALSYTPFSTLKDGFSRFKAADFAQIYQVALACFDWRACKSFQELGKLCLIDGSLFPTLLSMEWTTYKSQSNACKLHLCLELNRMLPTEFWVGSGNSSERAFVQRIAQKGVTYIADRGYFSFDLVEKLVEKEAFFVFRLKSNLLTTLIENKPLTHQVPFPACFERVTDQLIAFTNQPDLGRFRLVCFHIQGKQFTICTNRTDLTTLQIILLYAYRWQIELMFKFLKRTMNGLHLFNQSENGVQIQFYSLLTLALLQLRLKQVCQRQQKVVEQEQEKDDIEQHITYFKHEVAQFVKDISLFLHQSWKISKNFLIILKNNLSQVLDFHLIERLAKE